MLFSWDPGTSDLVGRSHMCESRQAGVHIFLVSPDAHEGLGFVLSHCSHVWLFMTLWTEAHQASLSMGFSRQEYLGGFPCPPPGDLSDLGIEPVSLKSPALAGRPFITSTTWEAPKEVLRPQKGWGLLCPSLQSSSERITMYCLASPAKLSASELSRYPLERRPPGQGCSTYFFFL